MVGMCTRPAIERAGNGNPPPTAGRARFLSQSFARIDVRGRWLVMVSSPPNVGQRIPVMTLALVSASRSAILASRHPSRTASAQDGQQQLNRPHQVSVGSERLRIERVICNSRKVVATIHI
jgi:hypothetical protein